MTTWVVDAILFDLDGTLVDSAGSVERSWRQLADKIGRPWPEVRPHIHGVPVPQVMAMLEPDMPPEKVEELRLFMIEYESTDTEGVVAQPSATQVLSSLPPDRVAIVTSGGIRLASARIAAAGLPTPGVVVTADDVTVGKPDPAPYLMGAKLLGFPPQRCLVVEDAPAGIASAKAAGSPVIGVLTTHPELDAPTVRTLGEITFSPVADGIQVSIEDGPGDGTGAGTGAGIDSTGSGAVGRTAAESSAH
ncbi:MAG TPA: HAD-IA family hydrolase [Nakamurella sp.]|nr:HAD-IA family hydrolase [Nakamurella sp.]